MWSEAYNDWLNGDEPDPANYSQSDYEMFEQLRDENENIDY